MPGLGDFNGDGTTDTWFRNTGRLLVDLWLMNGATYFVLGRRRRQLCRPRWSIALVGDYNGDGMSDLLWRDIERQHRDVVHERGYGLVNWLYRHYHNHLVDPGYERGLIIVGDDDALGIVPFMLKSRWPGFVSAIATLYRGHAGYVDRPLGARCPSVRQRVEMKYRGR